MRVAVAMCEMGFEFVTTEQGVLIELQKKYMIRGGESRGKTQSKTLPAAQQTLE